MVPLPSKSGDRDTDRARVPDHVPGHHGAVGRSAVVVLDDVQPDAFIQGTADLVAGDAVVVANGEVDGETGFERGDVGDHVAGDLVATAPEIHPRGRGALDPDVPEGVPIPLEPDRGTAVVGDDVAGQQVVAADDEQRSGVPPQRVVGDPAVRRVAQLGADLRVCS